MKILPWYLHRIHRKYRRIGCDKLATSVGLSNYIANGKAEDITAEVSWILISLDILTILLLIVSLENETCLNLLQALLTKTIVA